MVDANQPVSNTPQPSQPGPPPGPPALPPAPGKRPGFLLMAAIAVALAILAVATTGVVLTRSGGGGASYAADTPQAAVQAWAQAMEAHDYTTADSYLSENALANGESSQMAPFRDGTGFTIVGTSVQGDSATVDVTYTMDFSSVSPPGTGTMTMSATFELVRENGAWKIDGLDW
ncbi:MAG: hypothetical protein ABSB75_06725 [Candidatus Limnocylindrales bacterium]